MSHIAVWIGRSFIEITRFENRQKISKRAHYSLNSLSLQLKALLNGSIDTNSKVWLEWALPYVAVERRLGTAPALLTTAGCENWLELNLPLMPDHWSLQLRRADAPINRDLCFGVSERMSPQGESLRAPEKEELDFLVSKLRLNEVTHIAVGFLHSVKNPAHEQTTVAHFREQGFRTLGSYEWAPSKEERPRFWAPIVEAYVDEFLQEKVIEITTTLEGLGFINANLHLNGKPLSWFQQPERRWFNKTEIWTFQCPTLYCGIDEFLYFNAGAEDSDWYAPFGRVALPNLRGRRVTPGPLQVLEKNFWDHLDWSSESIEIEPGPICFGKAVTLTLMDILCHHGALREIQGVSERITERNLKKIGDSIRAYARGQSGRRDDQDIVDAVLRAACESWRLQCSGDGMVQLSGPLAPALYQVFKHVGLEAAVRLSHKDLYVSDLILEEVMK